MKQFAVTIKFSTMKDIICVRFFLEKSSSTRIVLLMDPLFFLKQRGLLSKKQLLGFNFQTAYQRHYSRYRNVSSQNDWFHTSWLRSLTTTRTTTTTATTKLMNPTLLQSIDTSLSRSSQSEDVDFILLEQPLESSPILEQDKKIWFSKDKVDDIETILKSYDQENEDNNSTYLRGLKYEYDVLQFLKRFNFSLERTGKSIVSCCFVSFYWCVVRERCSKNPTQRTREERGERREEREGE
jgi:hypothetical protein